MSFSDGFTFANVEGSWDRAFFISSILSLSRIITLCSKELIAIIYLSFFLILSHNVVKNKQKKGSVFIGRVPHNYKKSEAFASLNVLLLKSDFMRQQQWNLFVHHTFP